MTHIQTDKETAVSVWLWNNAEFVDQADELTGVLSDQERARRDRQFSRTKGLHWAISRARVRQILAELSGRSADQLQFDDDAYGHLTLRHSDLSLSISHDGSWTALAVGGGTRLGIDIESIKPLNREEMDWPLSKRERYDLSQVTDDRLLQAFFRYWTLKEAFIKALGLGVSFPLEDFDMSPFGSKPALLRVVGVPESPSDWSFEAYEIRPDLRLAIAVNTAGRPLNFSFHAKSGQ